MTDKRAGKQTLAERVRALPAPVAGLDIVIPLDLLPDYLELHQLTPARGQDGTLVVIRICPDGAE